MEGVPISCLTGAVPGEADEERRVGAEVCRPEVFGVGHHDQDVLLEGMVRLPGEVGLSSIATTAARVKKAAFANVAVEVLLVLLFACSAGRGKQENQGGERELLFLPCTRRDAYGEIHRGLYYRWFLQ